MNGDARGSSQRGERRLPPPLDDARLAELALGYAARYATTAAKLATYLRRKLRERGWADTATEPDVAGVVARLVELSYVDDRAWGAARARALSARGLGQRRVAQALHAAGVGGDDAAEAMALPDEDRDAAALAAAITFARRRRLGPFGPGGGDPDARRRAMAAMARAGHAFEVARRVLAAADVAAADALLDGA